MALLHNTNQRSALLGRWQGGLGNSLPGAGQVRPERKNFYFGEHAPEKKSGVIDGSLHPATWSMPVRAGAMAARGTVVGSGNVSGSIIAALIAQAALAGSGGASAAGVLIASLAATLSGAGNITAANLQLLLALAATISGAGGASGQAIGIGRMNAQLQGAGDLIAALSGTGNMSATLRGYGDLTPEGIRDAVWQASLANYQATGSAGQILSMASAGGVDLVALANAILAAAQVTPIHADMRQVRGQSINGSGIEADPWGP